MEFLQSNWFWIILIVFFIWMHSSGMGCGGGHGGHGGHGGDDGVDEKKKREQTGSGGGHQH